MRIHDAVNELYLLDLQEPLFHLGRLRWCGFRHGELREGFPTTLMDVNWDALNGEPRLGTLARTIRRLHAAHGLLPLVYLEAGGTLLANGAKIFYPSEEQYESMRKVDVHLPVGDFRAPFPAFVIAIPPNARRTMMREFDVPAEHAGRLTLLRHRYREPGDDSTMIALCTKMGAIEEHHIFQDQKGNEDIEAAISRRVDHVNPCSDSPELDAAFPDGMKRYATDAARAAINLALMLTHYGCHTVPVPSAGRSAPHKFRFNDYKEFIRLDREVVLRVNPAGRSEPGPPSGREMPCHWRRGHWRRLPGWEAYAERGEQAPLTFVRPALIRADKAGDNPISATYTVKT